MTNSNVRVASISNFSLSLNSLLLGFVAMLAYIARMVDADSVAAQNAKHRQCMTKVAGNVFNYTISGVTCTFSAGKYGIITKGKCSWCPPLIPTKPPTRAPQIKNTPGPTTPPKPTPDPTVQHTSNPTMPPRSKRPTPHPVRKPPTRRPTRRPTCAEAIAVPNANLNQKLGLQAAKTMVAELGSRPGLMRYVVEEAFKYCVLAVVSQNLVKLPASCLFDSIADANGTVHRYIPPGFYNSMELKSGYGAFLPEISYPGAEQAFYPAEYLGPNPQLYNFAYLTLGTALPISEDFSDIDQSASDELEAYASAHRPSAAPTKAKKGRHRALQNA